MAYRQFEIVDVRGLHRAAAEDFPNLVVVAGPNGAGKSTLLHQLYAQRAGLAEEGTRVTYLGPHRSWRRTQLGGSGLGELRPSFQDYLDQDAVPSWQTFQPRGLQHVAAGTARDPLGHEEAFSFVKGSILNLDLRQQRLLREVWERQDHRVGEGDVPPLLEPLRRTVRLLLPHLDLHEIDQADPQNLRVLFRRRDGQSDDVVELDDLSSGEKSVIGLMLPLVEAAANRLIGGGDEGPLPTAIIDEPENHLHPSLQVLLIEHLAELAGTNQGQFILATQSPTIVDALDDESLYLLAPVSAVPDGNQLVPIGRSQPRLEAMRALTGSTHLVTRCRPIVFIEGERPAARPISDQRLIEMLVPEAKGWMVVAAGGRGQAVRSAQQFREAAQETLPGVPVFALVDSDQAQGEDAEWVIPWDVAMVENLLLDPESIWRVLEPHAEDLELSSAAEVEAELRQIAANLESDEARLRVRSLSKPLSVRLRASTPEDVRAALGQAEEDLRETLGSLGGEDAIRAEFEAANAQVQAIVAAGRELEAFRGKLILKALHDRQVNRCGLSYKAFTYAVAREAAGQSRVQGLTAPAVHRIHGFVPLELVETIGKLADELPDGEEREHAQRLQADLRAARAVWEAGEEVEVDLESLRGQVVELGRGLPEASAEAIRLPILAAALGTRPAVADRAS